MCTSFKRGTHYLNFSQIITKHIQNEEKNNLPFADDTAITCSNKL